MHSYLRQSTALQVRSIGPFVDDTDFKTLRNSLTIANTDILIKKNGGTGAAKNSGGATGDTGGMYHLTFDATDSNTVGELMLSVKVSGALVVVAKFWVLEEAVYDALFTAGSAGYGTAQTGDNFARLGAPSGASLAADVLELLNYPRKTVMRGTVGNATTPSTTQFTPSALSPAGVDASQFNGRIIVFDNDTTTTALRGQMTDITAVSAASLPLFTFSALTRAPASGDTFSIL